jgi:monoamine oxidase
LSKGSARQQLRECLEKSWGDDPYCRGVNSGYYTTGVWTTSGDAVRAPIGVLHWGSSERSQTWNGAMGGAVRAGERAANEVLAALP